MRTIVPLALVLAAAPALAAQDAPDPDASADTTIRVTRAVVATAVEDREPAGVADAFADTVGTVYFYTVLEGDFAETRIEHVWLREGEEMARVQLRAEGPRWRTWSSKRIREDWTGEWEARVVTSDGRVLERTSFTVGESTQAAAVPVSAEPPPGAGSPSADAAPAARPAAG